MWLNVEAQKTITENQTRNKSACFWCCFVFVFVQNSSFLYTTYISIPYLIAQSVRKTLVCLFCVLYTKAVLIVASYMLTCLMPSVTLYSSIAYCVCSLFFFVSFYVFVCFFNFFNLFFYSIWLNTDDDVFRSKTCLFREEEKSTKLVRKKEMLWNALI